VSAYLLASFAERRPSPEELTALTQLCFASYQGVVLPTSAHTAWFTFERPGFRPELCQAAWDGGDLVASLYVTRARLDVGGCTADFGLIDTVMTHPLHRRRGLARAVLERACERAAQAGLAGLLLYTQPGSPGFSLYQSLGFTVVASLWHWLREPMDGGAPGAWRRLDLTGQYSMWALLLEKARARYEGVPVPTEDLWRWRALRGPLAPQTAAWVHPDAQEPENLLLARRSSLTGGAEATVLKDLVLGPNAPLAALAAEIGREIPLLAVVDRQDTALAALLRGACFRPVQEEAIMLLPLSEPQVPARLAAAERPWFPLVESDIGV
jgi:GNAT superfamily N-acetyltransferase